VRDINISKGDINEHLWFQRMLEARLHAETLRRASSAATTTAARRSEMDPFDPEKVAALRESLRQRAARRVQPHPAPRYDDVFYEGVAWLDSLAGPDDTERGAHREDKSRG
jgi:hypothetical protein